MENGSSAGIWQSGSSFWENAGVALSLNVRFRKEKNSFRSFILVNPYQLWDESLVRRFWNIQERIEFLVARILFTNAFML